MKFCRELAITLFYILKKYRLPTSYSSDVMINLVHLVENRGYFDNFWGYFDFTNNFSSIYTEYQSSPCWGYFDFDF